MTSHTTNILPTTTPSSRRSHPSQAIKSFATSNIHSNNSQQSAFEVAIETLFRQVNERLERTNNQKERNHSQLLIGQIERGSMEITRFTPRRESKQAPTRQEKRRNLLSSALDIRSYILSLTTEPSGRPSHGVKFHHVVQQDIMHKKWFPWHNHKMQVKHITPHTYVPQQGIHSNLRGNAKEW